MTDLQPSPAVEPSEIRCVYIVDDDHDVRSSISFMLRARGLESRSFESGREFLDAAGSLEAGSILLDVRMPDMDGVEILEELGRQEIDWPVIIMTGHGEVALAVQTMKLGAIDFLEKPFEEDVLQTCLARAADMLACNRAAIERRREARDRVGALTEREMQVLQALIDGLPNKLIAHRLGISLRTAEMHRANLMQHLGVRSLAETLRLAADAGVKGTGER